MCLFDRVPPAAAAPAPANASGTIRHAGQKSSLMSSSLLIGKIVNDKSVPLSQDDIEFCKSKRLKFKTTISKKSIEDVIDEVTVVENDDDEEIEKETDEILEEED